MIANVQSPHSVMKASANQPGLIASQAANLSVIGREIIASQPQNKIKANAQLEQTDPLLQKQKSGHVYKPSLSDVNDKDFN